MKGLNLPIIGYMNSPYREKFGIPRQPNLVQVESYIEMEVPLMIRLLLRELRNSAIYGLFGNFMTIKISTIRLNFVHKLDLHD